jgi:hypothetical protein
VRGEVLVVVLGPGDPGGDPDAGIECLVLAVERLVAELAEGADGQVDAAVVVAAGGRRDGERHGQ